MYKVALESNTGEIVLFRESDEQIAQKMMENFYNDVLCASVEFYPICPLGEIRTRYIRKDFIHGLRLEEEV